MRIGHGYDVHAFQPGGQLILGGVPIDYPQSLAAHSDGDVLIHAVCDALLGAAGLGDIGQHFPDTDPAWAGIDSRVLLRQVVALLPQHALAVGNVDVTVVAQAPKLAGYMPTMRECLAADLGIAVNRINIKATTTEKLGFCGRQEGIAVYAVALLKEL